MSRKSLLRLPTKPTTVDPKSGPSFTRRQHYNPDKDSGGLEHGGSTEPERNKTNPALLELMKERTVNKPRDPLLKPKDENAPKSNEEKLRPKNNILG